MRPTRRDYATGAGKVERSETAARPPALRRNIRMIPAHPGGDFLRFRNIRVASAHRTRAKIAAFSPRGAAFRDTRPPPKRPLPPSARRRPPNKGVATQRHAPRAERPRTYFPRPPPGPHAEIISTIFQNITIFMRNTLTFLYICAIISEEGSAGIHARTLT